MSRSKVTVDTMIVSATESYCAAVLDDESMSQYIQTKKMRDDPLFDGVFDAETDERTRARKISYALRDLEYAEKWSAGTWYIDPDADL